MVPILPVDFLFLYRPSGYRKEKKTLYVFTKGGWTTLSLFPSRIAFPLSGRLYSQRRYVAPTQRRVYINTSALSLSNGRSIKRKLLAHICAVYPKSSHFYYKTALQWTREKENSFVGVLYFLTRASSFFYVTWLSVYTL